MASKDQVPFSKPVTVEEIDYKEIEILEVGLFRYLFDVFHFLLAT